MLPIIKSTLQSLRNNKVISSEIFGKAQQLYLNEGCLLLTQSKEQFDFLVEDEEGNEKEVQIQLGEELAFSVSKKQITDWDLYSVAALFELMEKGKQLDTSEVTSGRKYTREGMIRRVMAERRQRAFEAEYQVEWADNIYGEHILINEKGVEYRLTLRDFENETGYVDSIDWRTNKLGTTKHLMFAFRELKSDPKLMESLSKEYPFVEVYLNPLNQYKITWFYPHELDSDVKKLLRKYFGDAHVLPEEKLMDFLHFIQEASEYDQILVRPEVRRKIEAAYNHEMLKDLRRSYQPDYSKIKATLFSYQKEGVDFALFREGAIIADEMGLGKTLQAITTAILKKEIFDFKRTLIVCPASLKAQWKSEIEKFTDEKAVILEGLPANREMTYRETDAFFLIVNYETVLRDRRIINENPMDFVILDEAQRIKNYNTKTAQSVKKLERRHSLIITGTPIENRLIDLFSVVQFIDPEFLAPLWEFSYQHCYFDMGSKNRVTGYYNLQALKKRIQQVLIRREKRNVIRQLPNVTQLHVPVHLHPQQAEYHASFAQGIAAILRKKFKTPYDWQKLMLLLSNMRMVCNSTFLIDKKTNFSPKLSELRRILLEKLDVRNNKRKIIIFSEWVRSHQLIGEVLRELDIGYTELSGKIPVKKRGELIRKFEEDDNCRVFLSTEAGGAGLNLQMADTVINFELPWNPAKKNQRIGRIDRLGQTHDQLTVINLISRNSIEEKIATGLVLKQSLFEGVLDSDDETDVVDFAQKGRSQFFEQLESTIGEFEQPIIEEVEEEKEVTLEPETVSDEIIEPDETLDKPLVPRKRRPRPARSPQKPEMAPALAEEAQMAATVAQSKESAPQVERFEQMETVMNQGLQFLAGLYKLSTGEDMAAEEQKVEIDRETGEVVMRFKMKF